MKIVEFARAVTERAPTPGGGSVLAVQAALSIGLMSMVVTYSISKKRTNDDNARLADVLNQLEGLRYTALGLADGDAEAYGTLNRLIRADQAPLNELREAAVRSAGVPIDVMHACAAALEHVTPLARILNVHLRSDALIASQTLAAIARCARHLVPANQPQPSSVDAWDVQLGRADAALGQANAAAEAFERSLRP